jgi:hypothetical protein
VAAEPDAGKFPIPPKPAYPDRSFDRAVCAAGGDGGAAGAAHRAAGVASAAAANHSAAAANHGAAATANHTST